MGVDIEALKQLTDAKGMPLEQLIQAIEAGVLRRARCRECA